MKFASLPFFLFLISLIVTGCSEPPMAPQDTEVSHEGTLTYRVLQYDGFTPADSTAQVVYKTLDNETVVDTVAIPWEKSFDYQYTTSSDSLRDFNAQLVVRYEGNQEIVLIAGIAADEKVDISKTGRSFYMTLNSTLKLPR